MIVVKGIRVRRRVEGRIVDEDARVTLEETPKGLVVRVWVGSEFRDISRPVSKTFRPATELLEGLIRRELFEGKEKFLTSIGFDGF